MVNGFCFEDVATILPSASERCAITRPRAKLNSLARVGNFDFAERSVPILVCRVITDGVLRSELSGNLSKCIGQRGECVCAQQSASGFISQGDEIAVSF